MNVSFPIPQEFEAYVETQLQSGGYNSADEYFLALLKQDHQRKEAQGKLTHLLQEGLNSDSEEATSNYWQNLRLSILGTEE